MEAPQVVMPSPDASSEGTRESVASANRWTRPPGCAVNAHCKNSLSIRTSAWSSPCHAAFHPSRVECMFGKAPCKPSRRLLKRRPCSCFRAHFQAFRTGGAHGGAHRRDDAVRTRVINARFEFRGVRVGEASHPSPTARRRRRVRSSSSCGNCQGVFSSDDQREVDVPCTVVDPTTQATRSVRGTQVEVSSDDECQCACQKKLCNHALCPLYQLLPEL